MRPAPLALATLTAVLTLAAGASPGGRPRHMVASRTLPLGPSALRYGRSIGSPTEGHLVGGSHLDETSYLRVVPADAPGDVRWALEPLVDMIERASRTVRRQFPDAVTSVGHLSREGGGEIDQHRSHESGRDADIGFFIHGQNGRQLLPTHFVPFAADGSAPTWPGAFFDDAKNWALVSAMVSDPQAHVTHVFVAVPLRARLLAYAERAGVPGPQRMKAAELMQQPRGALPHDDHFHVRIACPAHQSGCVENPPARNRHAGATGPTFARGRRGGTNHDGGELSRPQLTTPAPSRSSLPPLPGSDSPVPGGGDSTPPASAVVPIDDVDG